MRMSPADGGTGKVLCLAGGGYMGYYAALLLAELERRAALPLARCFDLIAGVSVGGIFALALAKGVAAAKLVELFEKYGDEVFDNRPPPRNFWQTLREANATGFKPKYDGKRLAKALRRTLGATSTFADLPRDCSVFATSVSLKDGSPFYFASEDLSSRFLPAARCSPKTRLVEAAMAASAVPGYFAPVRVKRHGFFVDGGLFAPQPDIQALAVAKKRFRRVKMLSLGTSSAVFGEMAEGEEGKVGLKIGNFGWLKQQRLLKLAMSSGQQAITAHMRAELGADYIRLDAAQSPTEQKKVGIDGATPIAKKVLAGLAAATRLPAGALKLLEATKKFR